MRFTIIPLFLLFFFFTACEKKPQDNNQPPLIEKGKGVFILNEGNFQWGNASVSYYRTDNNTLYDDIFNTINNRHLGDVCQSMYIYNDKAYIIVNNSQKIEVVDVNTFQSISTINGLASPRYFLPVSQTKAYVSDMSSNAVSIIDLNTNTKTGEIPCSGSNEEMLLLNNKVYITNTSTSYLYIADALTDHITDSIHLSYGTVSVKLDNTAKLWVLCMGNQADHTNAALYKVNPANNSIELSLPFTTPLNVWNKIKMNQNCDTMYFSNGNVFRMKTTDNQLPHDTLIKSGNRNFYGLGVDPGNGYLYISDAIDYVQEGKIYVYSPNGDFIKTFNAGIIPGEFCFY